MRCSYYKKAGFRERLKGIRGYCELQNCSIMRKAKIGTVPYIYCEGLKGKSNSQCGIFNNFAHKFKE